MVLLDIVSTGLTLWGLVSMVQNPRVGVPDVEHKTLAPQGKDFLRSLLIAGQCTWAGISGKSVISASPPYLNVALLFFAVEELFVWFSELFQRKLFQM